MVIGFSGIIPIQDFRVNRLYFHPTTALLIAGMRLGVGYLTYAYRF